MRISDWSSDVCSSDLRAVSAPGHRAAAAAPAHQPCASGVVERAAGPAGAATGVPGTGRRAVAGHRRAGHRSLSARCDTRIAIEPRSEEHTSELQSLMRNPNDLYLFKTQNGYQIER